MEKGSGKEGGAKAKVVSVRLDPGTHRRLHAYALGTGQADSAALRELAVRGLATDGLELYSTELGEFVRGLMAAGLAQLDGVLERRGDELEDRVARIVARGARQAGVGSLVAVDLARATFPGLRDVPAEDVYARYSQRAGEMQAGRTFKEALDHAR